jgi:hypothetical protein
MEENLESKVETVNLQKTIEIDDNENKKYQRRVDKNQKYKY